MSKGMGQNSRCLEAQVWACVRYRMKKEARGEANEQYRHGGP